MPPLARERIGSGMVLEQEFAAAPQRFHELAAGHFQGHLVQILLGFGQTLSSRNGEPFVGFHEILWHTFTSLIHHAEVGLRLRQPLVGRLAIPLDGLDRILGYPFPRDTGRQGCSEPVRSPCQPPRETT
jgi:hypothetical protein